MEAVVGLFFVAVDDRVTGGDRPCSIASWSASTFGYFDAVADIIRDPRLADDAPELEQVDLLADTQCAKGDND